MRHAARMLESLLAIGVTGLLWALASVPLVTMVPATVAVFGVFTAWIPGRPPVAVWTTFWQSFVRHFKQAFGFGLLLFVALAILSADLWYGLYAEDAPLQPVVLGAGVLGTVLLAGTLIFLFPVITTYPDRWRRVLRNSALLAAGNVWITLTGLFCWAVAAVVVFNVPPLVPFAVAGAAFAVSRLTGRAFERLEYMLGRTAKPEPDSDSP